MRECEKHAGKQANTESVFAACFSFWYPYGMDTFMNGLSINTGYPADRAVSFPVLHEDR